jgi:hypothetical protein
MSLVRRHRWWFLSGAVAFAGLVTFVLLYFAPQDLLIDTHVNEALPAPTAAGGPAAGGPSSSAEPTSQRPPVQILAQGRFRSGEHDTSGSAKLLVLRDGRRYVRLESLSTSNGPAVRIWLSAARSGASDDTVGAADHLDLGGLKANHGNQNYEVPSAAPLGRFRSVVIWCRRFDVVFGSAPIR